MKPGNFLLIYIVLSLLLLFPIKILGENASNHLMKEPGGKFRYNTQRKLEEEDGDENEGEGYISITFGEDVEYSNFEIVVQDPETGDKIVKRRFKKLVYDGVEVYNSADGGDKGFSFAANKILKIYIDTTDSKMQSFFDAEYDPNCKKIISVDLSHFHSDNVDSTWNMFRGCSSLQSINFTNSKIAQLEDVSGMFSNCQKLVSLDLSYLNTSLVYDMSKMFYNDTSLEYLDISNFNPKSGGLSVDEMFDGLESIKYINLFNMKSEKIKGAFTNADLSSKNDLIICQSEKFITNDNLIYLCCDFSKSPLQCDNNNNYIIVKYKDTVNYTSGFFNDNIPSRNKTSYINNQGSFLGIRGPLIIEANNSIEIHISNEIESLDNFFDGEFDENSKSIIYVDLSHLNTSLITSTSKMFHKCNSIQEINFTNFDSSFIESMSGMFSECSSLELIDLSNFNTEKVKNMSSMFSGCNSITSINLSSFNTINTTDMSEMFYGCDNLEILDISNFDTTKCDSYNNMFSYYANLKYINIKNLKSDTILKDSFNNTKLFYVCQSTNLIQNSKAFNCCVEDIENNECDIPSTTIIDESSFLVESTEEILSSEIAESITNTQIKYDTNEVTTTEIIEEKEKSTGLITNTIFNSTYIPNTFQIFESTVLTTSHEIIKNITIPTTIVTTEPIFENSQTTIQNTMNEANPSTIEKTEKASNIQIKNDTIDEKGQTTII